MSFRTIFCSRPSVRRKRMSLFGRFKTNIGISGSFLSITAKAEQRKSQLSKNNYSVTGNL